MKLSNFIAGLEILRSHFNEDSYDIGAEHDIIYVYSTDTPLTHEEVVKMIELGWFNMKPLRTPTATPRPNTMTKKGRGPPMSDEEFIGSWDRLTSFVMSAYGTAQFKPATTPPMMYPEWITCVIARAVKDAIKECNRLRDEEKQWEGYTQDMELR